MRGGSGWAWVRTQEGGTHLEHLAAFFEEARRRGHILEVHLRHGARAVHMPDFLHRSGLLAAEGEGTSNCQENVAMKVNSVNIWHAFAISCSGHF